MNQSTDQNLTPQERYKRTEKGRTKQRESHQRYMEKNQISLWQVTLNPEQEEVLNQFKPEDMSKASFLREVVIPAYLEEIDYPDKFLVF